MAPYRPEEQPLYFLKSFLLLVGMFASVTVALPCAGLGLAGIFGRLADAGYAFNVRTGLFFLGVSFGIWIATFACSLWWSGRLPQRFGMRALLGALTVIAVLAALISALLRMSAGS